MSQLSFDYDDSRGCEVAEYRGLTIKAERDEFASNPFTDWDCEPPTMVISGRHGDCSDYSGGELDSPLELISDGKLRLSRFWKAAAKAVDLCPVAFDQEAKERARDYGESIIDARRELLSDALHDMRPSYYSGNAGDYLSALADLWTLAGCEALSWSSQGYSQGDYADGLSVATPAWAKKVGAPVESHARQLEGARKLWGAWAWGDVYAFVIENSEGDILDSCCGFYGDCHKESGLAEAAKDAADCIIASAKARRIEAAKVAIRNRIPLSYRPALLAQAGALA